MNSISTLVDRFKSLTAWSLEDKIHCAIRDKGPEERGILKALNTPSIEVQHKPNYVPNAYVADGGITIVTNEDKPFEDEVDMVYVNLIGMLEKQGGGNSALQQERLQLSDRLFTDHDGHPARFTMSDLDGDYDGGPNADLLRSVVKMLDDTGFDECHEILNALRDDSVVIRVQPSSGDRTSAQYLPERSEMKVTYAPEMDEQTKVAIIALRLIHEGCHHIQNRNGMIAEVAEEPDNFRELMHLNELQAHIVQYKVVMQLFAQSDAYEQFTNGRLSIDDLETLWEQSDDVKDKMCQAYLINQYVGRDILGNIAMHSQHNSDDFDPNDLERYIKEALNHGEIVDIKDGIVSYDDQNLSRMQRYAHAHVSVLNFSNGYSGGWTENDDIKKIDLACQKHFEGPLGISKDDIEVHFVAPDFSFNSAVTGRLISVEQVESMWEKMGSTLTSLGGRNSQKPLSFENETSLNLEESFAL
ncbi:MAG: hypothetical protein COA45_10920 [Zetaproteobacteria bacterium]|nr:MAG: hypothetical protein COA45_10920 [Zetaproteobacteria bacterium]